MTHRIYKNEYCSKFINQIRHNIIEGIEFVDETENVITVSGKEEDLERISLLMYVTCEKIIKSIFPSFISDNDLVVDSRNMRLRLLESVRNELLEMLNKYEYSGMDKAINNNKEIEAVYEAYKALMNV